MSTHNICFCREIRKIICGYPLLSVAMLAAFSSTLFAHVVNDRSIPKDKKIYPCSTELRYVLPLVIELYTIKKCVSF